jgi:hypothetical protein
LKRKLLVARRAACKDRLPSAASVRNHVINQRDQLAGRPFGSLTGDGFSRSTFINNNSALTLRRLETEAQRLGPIFTFKAPPEARYPRRVRVVRAAGEKTPLIGRSSGGKTLFTKIAARSMFGFRGRSPPCRWRIKDQRGRLNAGPR